MALSGALLTGCFDKSAEQYLAAARADMAKNDNAAAVIQLKNALQANPSLAEARVLLGEALLKGGDARSALIELGKAKELGLADDRIVPLIAQAMLGQGQFAKVISDFSEAKLTSSTAMADLHASLATAYSAAGNAEKARELANAAVAADPNDQRAQLIRIRLVAAASGLAEGLAAADALLAKSPKSADAWEIKGDLLRLQGKPDEAMTAYRSALALDKAHVLAHAGVLSLLLVKNDLNGADEQLAAMRKALPKNPATQLYGATVAMERGDLKKANEEIDRVLKAAPEDPRALQLAGMIKARRGALLEADRYLAKVVTAAPTNVNARILLAQTQLRQGDAARCLATLQPILADGAPHPAAMGLAADAYLQQGDAKQAEEYFAKIASSDPSDVRAHIAVALANIGKGRKEQGVADLRKIVSGDAGISADLALLNLHMSDKDFQAASRDIDGIEKKTPAKAVPFNLRGRLELSAGNVSGARQAFESALKVDPNFYSATAALAALDIGDKNYTAAADRFQKVLNGNPNDLSANMGLIAVREQAGASKTELADLLTKLIAKVPGEAAPRLTLVNIYMQDRAYKEALVVAQEGVAALPENPEMWAAVGRVQNLSGSFDLAVSAFNKQIALRPNAPQSYMPLAELYASRGDRSSAAKMLNRALTLQPNFKQAQVALVALSVAKKDFKEAGRVIQVMQTQYPNDSTGAELWGDIEAGQKHWQGAVASYRGALSKGASPEIAVKIARALVAAGDLASLKKFEVEWTAAHPGDLLFRYFLGDRAMQQQDWGAAEVHYLAALKAAPNNAGILNNLAWIKFKSNKPDALEFAEKARKIAPREPAFMDTLAQIYAGSGRVDKAAELQKQAVESAPGNASYRLSLARYYIGLGQKDAARAELTQLSGLGDTVPQQQEAKKLLTAL